MRISRDGRVVIEYQGQAYNGRYNVGQIYANGNVSSVSQTIPVSGLIIGIPAKGSTTVDDDG